MSTSLWPCLQQKARISYPDARWFEDDKSNFNADLKYIQVLLYFTIEIMRQCAHFNVPVEAAQNVTTKVFAMLAAAHEGKAFEPACEKPCMACVTRMRSDLENSALYNQIKDRTEVVADMHFLAILPFTLVVFLALKANSVSPPYVRYDEEISPEWVAAHLSKYRRNLWVFDE